MKKYLILIMPVLFLLYGFGIGKDPDVKLNKIKIFKDLIEIKVPSHFVAMKDFEIKKYYPKEGLPQLVFSNSDKSRRLAFDTEDLGTVETSITDLKNRFEKMLKGLYPKAKWKGNNIISVDGRDMGYLELITKKPEKNYRLMFFTSFKGRLLIGNLICPKKKYKVWQKIGNEIMNSLVIHSKS